MKKIVIFLLWAILLCLLFLFSLYITDGALLTSVIIWLLLIVGIYLCSLIKSALSFLNKKNYFHKLLPRWRFSRAEHLLFAQWKKGEQLLRQMRRRKALPWFIVTGPRCGKSTLLASGALQTGAEEAKGQTLRWWFFREAAFLELSGTLLQPKKSLALGWRRMVGWFHNAPHGIVVTIAAAELLAEEGKEAQQTARHVRLQLAPLLKKLKRRLPIYLIVTGCDALPGFTVWLNKLSAQQKQRLLGRHWPHPLAMDAEPALDQLFLPLKTELDRRCMTLFSGQQPDDETAALLALPEQMMQLQRPVERCLKALCENDAFSVAGRPGGIWFTAATPGSVKKPEREACFVSDLPARLAALSRQQPVEHTNCCRRYFSRWGKLTIAVLALVLIVLSGGFTLRLLAGSATADLTENIARYQHTEQALHHPLRYLPFLPVIYRYQRQLEARLVAAAALSPLSLNPTERYREVFNQADARTQRELILALSEAIATQQAMREGAALDMLARLPATPPLLAEQDSPRVLSPLHALIVQRARAQSPAGAAQLTRLRQLLATLVNQDPHWGWLRAADETLPALRSQTLLPGSTGDSTLSGIWTAQGGQKAHRWLHSIRQAAGETAKLPVLDEFEQQQTALRQQAWLTFIIELGSLPVPAWDSDQWRERLLAIAQGDGPSQRFFTLVRQELADINDRDAAPWLRQLRLLLDVRDTATSGSLRQWLRQGENQLRDRHLSWLKEGESYVIPVVSTARVTAWREMQKSQHQAAMAALTTSLTQGNLTAGLFGPDEQQEKNPLLQLRQPFDALRKALAQTPDGPDVEAVWALFGQEQRLLVAYAMRQTGCWLQQRWQSGVLWPLEKNAGRLNHQAQLAQAESALSAFMRGPARSVLSVDRHGVTAGTFAGQSVPLTPSFLRLVNDTLDRDDLLALPERTSTLKEEAAHALAEQQQSLKEQQSALQARSATLTLRSLPATVPGGARLMPTGSRLDLDCDDRRWSLKSMNFSDSATFRWQPGHCHRVMLTIEFPGFELTYHYRGDSAWPDFINDIASGQHSYRAEMFPQQAALLEAQGIREVMVRYQSDSLAELQDLWRQWRELEQALAENEAARQQLQTERRGLPPPALSSLPVIIASCH